MKTKQHLAPIPPRTTAFDIEGHPLTIIEMEDKLYFIAKEVGDFLGYGEDGSRLSTLITREWAEEMKEGEHWTLLDGERLRVVKGILRDTQDPLHFASRLLLLTERGLWRALILTGKPAGVRLRDRLDSDILPQIHKTGAYALPGAEPRPQSLLAEIKELRGLAADLRRAGDHVRSRRVLAHVADLVSSEKNGSPSTQEPKPVQPEEDGLAEQAIRVVWAWMNRLASRFASGAKGGPSPKTCLGRWDRSKEWTIVAFMPAFLNRELETAGFVPDEVMRAWDGRGWVFRGEGRNRQKRIYLNGALTRCLVLHRRSFNAVTVAQKEEDYC